MRGSHFSQPLCFTASFKVVSPHLFVAAQGTRAFVFFHERKVNTLGEIPKCGYCQWRNRAFVERLQQRFCQLPHAGPRLVRCIDRCEPPSPLHCLKFTAHTYTLAVPEHPPSAMPHDVSGLICFSHGCSFRLVLGIPAEALPPNAAMRFRSPALSFWFRASPALRAISLRSAGLNFFNLAAAPSLPSAEACGLGFLAFIVLTLTKRLDRVKQVVFCRTVDES